MSSTLLIGLANTHEQSHFVVDRLLDAGFSTAISTVLLGDTSLETPRSLESSGEAGRHWDRFTPGDILITVQVEDSKATRRAKEILVRTGVRDVESLDEERAETLSAFLERALGPSWSLRGETSRHSSAADVAIVA